MVTQMTIPEKLEALAVCIAKCENVEYSIQAALGDNKEEAIRELMTIVDTGRKLFLSGQVENLDYTGRKLFLSGQVENLDYDVRQDAYNKWDTKLTEKLCLFPEYGQDLEQASTMHM